MLGIFSFCSSLAMLAVKLLLDTVLLSVARLKRQFVLSNKALLFPACLSLIVCSSYALSENSSLGVSSDNIVTDIDEFLILDFGVGHSGNVFNSTVDKRSDTLFSYGAAFGFDYVGASSTFKADYQLSNTEFLEDSFDAEHREAGNIYFDLHSQRQILTWFFSRRSENVFSGVSQQQPISNDNRSQRITQSTGPRVKLRFSPRDTLLMSAVKTTSSIGQSNADSDSLATFANYIHRFSNKTSVEFELSQSTIEPENFVVNGAVIDDFEQLSQSVKLSRRIRVGDFFIKVGNSQIDDLKNALSGEKVSSPTYQFGLNATGALGSVYIDFSQDLTDSSVASEFISEVVQTTNNIGNVAAPEFIVERRDKLQVSYSSPKRYRHGWNVYYSRQENQDEVGASEERVLEEYRAGYSHSLSSRLSLGLSLSRVTGEARRFGSAQLEDVDQVRTRASIEYIMSKKLTSECGIEQEDFSGQSGFQNAKSNNISCSILYTVF